jgi:steroid 5-alpha reductase family enzyme
MPAVVLLIAIFGSMSLAMVVGWACQRAWNNGGWTDAFWSFSVGMVGVAAALAPVGQITAPSLRQGLVAALVGLWSLRLGRHIAARAGEGPEDARYAALRTEWGPAFQRRMFSFLQTQAAAGAFLVLTVALAAHNPSPDLRPADVAAAALFILSVAGAGIADQQLAVFRRNPDNRGKVCDVGLWALSRHPNYFFEWLGWTAYAVIAVDPGGTYGIGWLSVTGPAFIYYLLRHVSGVPLLEAAMLRSRGEAYVTYQARVSAFFPWPPRRPQMSDGAV